MSLRRPGPTRPIPAAPNALRFLNQPRPIHVIAERRPDTAGPIPIAILQDGYTQPVERLEDTWLLEDEWWRQRICRRYFRLTLADGLGLTVYHECTGDAWYVQGY